MKVSGYKCTHMCDVVGGADCGENDEISHTLETEGVSRYKFAALVSMNHISLT